MFPFSRKYIEDVQIVPALKIALIAPENFPS
jgi:hypothetical protein